MNFNSDRHLSDIHGMHKKTRAERAAAWFRHPKIINLKPTVYRRHQAWIILILIVIGISIFAARKIFTRAQVADFFPGSCLGTWQNPILAQGQPETLAEAAVPLDEKNAAIFTGGDQQIFCGSFVPSSFEAKGELKNVGLTLAWRMEGAAPEPIQESPPASSSSETIVPLPPVSEPSSSASLRIPAQWLPVAFAEESDPSAVPPADSPAEAPPDQAPVSPPIIIAPPLEASLTDSASSTPFPTETTSTQDNVGTPPPIVSGPPPDERFLSVKYSLDGQTWIELQKVGVENWQNFTIDLPVKTWDDLQKIQIRVEGVPTTAKNIPQMYLDGMVLEAHYEEAPILNGDEITAPSTDSTLIEVDEHTTIEVPPALPPPLVPPPEIVSSTKSGNRLHLVIRFVGEFYGNNPVNVFLYPEQTRALRNSASGGFSFAEQPSEGSFMDSVSLYAKDFDQDKESSFDIISPVADPDYGLNSADVIPGKYSIDMGYYDGQTWHKTAPQTFDWP